LKSAVYSDVRIAGFKDDHAPSRLEVALYPPLGRIEDLPQLVKRHRIELVYLALPMTSCPRTQRLLEALRDTTAPSWELSCAALPSTSCRSTSMCCKDA
jgi:putative colanic acid biosynthesis UDP-glucose lipid carrier transferase